VIFLGPQAQEILRPFLEGRHPGHYLFSAREAVEGYLKSQGRKIRHGRGRQPGECYRVDSYDHAVAKGVKAANRARACEPCKQLPPEQRCPACRANAIPHWAPNQLRHAKATEIRREAGLDAARAVLGHRSPVVTEVYAELDADKAAALMAKLG
jgi:hypothetical protein